MPETVDVLTHRARAVPPAAVLELYRAEGWWPERTAEQLAAVLDATPAVGAWAGDELVGFARLVTDGAFRAYVEDLVVRADHRGRGVGRALLAAVHALVPAGAVGSLFCHRDLAGWYADAGWRPSRQVVLHDR